MRLLGRNCRISNNQSSHRRTNNQHNSPADNVSGPEDYNCPLSGRELSLSPIIVRGFISFEAAAKFIKISKVEMAAVKELRDN